LKPAETTSNADAACEERPADSPFLAKKAQPGPGVGFDRAIGLADQATLHMQGLLSNRDSGFGRLLASEDQVIHGIDALGLSRLKDDMHGVEKTGDGRWTETVDVLLCLVRKYPSDVFVGI
jgi:hypothetical protein